MAYFVSQSQRHTETDFIFFKIFACGLRPTAAKKQRDADDAHSLLEQQQGGLRLSSQQQECIAPALQDLLTNGSIETDQAWWEAKLGLWLALQLKAICEVELFCLNELLLHSVGLACEHCESHRVFRHPERTKFEGMAATGLYWSERSP
jgi:hypothetical protein